MLLYFSFRRANQVYLFKSCYLFISLYQYNLPVINMEEKDRRIAQLEYEAYVNRQTIESHREKINQLRFRLRTKSRKKRVVYKRVPPPEGKEVNFPEDRVGYIGSKRTGVADYRCYGCTRDAMWDLPQRRTFKRVSIDCPIAHAYCTLCEEVWGYDSRGRSLITCQYPMGDGTKCGAASYRPVCDVIPPKWYDPAMKVFRRRWKKITNGVRVTWVNTETGETHVPEPELDEEGNVIEITDVTCFQCMAVFTSEHYLKMHRMREHGSTKNFPCIKCDYKGMAFRDIERHQKNKMGCRKLQIEENKKCKICREGFFDTSNAKRHMLTCVKKSKSG